MGFEARYSDLLYYNNVQVMCPHITDRGTMWTKMKSISQVICDVLEWILAIIVCIGIVITIITFLQEVIPFAAGGATPDSFLIFLGNVFNIVVGVEFLKMLCKPSSDNVIEVLIFLVTRHMIIGTSTSLDDLFSIIGIALLFLVRSYLRKIKARSKKESADS